MRNPLGTGLPPRRALIARARAAIERAGSLDELKAIRDQAEAARHYANAAKMGKGMADRCAEIRLRAERRAGQILAATELHNGDPRSHDETRPRLTDLGVSKNQSHRWQRLADVPEEDFEQYLSDTRDKGEEITSKGAAVLAARGWLRDPLSYLAPGERCLIETRLHWVVPVKAMFRAGVGMAVMTAVLMLLVIAAPGALVPKMLVCGAAVAHAVWLLYSVALWRVGRIVVSDRRIIRVHGIFTTAVDSVQLDQITDLTYRRPFIGRILGHGTLIVESAGQRQGLETLDYVPDAPAVYRALTQALTRLERRAGRMNGPGPGEALPGRSTARQRRRVDTVRYLCMIRVMRKTRPLVQVAIALLDDPTGRHWGYELSKRSGVRSGVLYPMLTRMLDEGWVEDGWEDPNTLREKRPPRRYYQLTDEGRLALGGVLQQAHRDTRFTDLHWRFA